MIEAAEAVVVPDTIDVVVPLISRAPTTSPATGATKNTGAAHPASALESVATEPHVPLRMVFGASRSLSPIVTSYQLDGWTDSPSISRPQASLYSPRAQRPTKFSSQPRSEASRSFSTPGPAPSSTRIVASLEKVPPLIVSSAALFKFTLPLTVVPDRLNDSDHAPLSRFETTCVAPAAPIPPAIAFLSP